MAGRVGRKGAAPPDLIDLFHHSWSFSLVAHKPDLQQPHDESAPLRAMHKAPHGQMGLYPCLWLNPLPGKLPAKKAENWDGISSECAWFCVKPDHCLALVRAHRGDGEEFAVCRSRKGLNMRCAALPWLKHFWSSHQQNCWWQVSFTAENYGSVDFGWSDRSLAGGFSIKHVILGI